MSISTKKSRNEGQPFEVEELIRSLDEVPPVSRELRSRVLVAASQAAGSAKRQKGWGIVAGFAATCAACVLAFAFFRTDTTQPARPMAEETAGELVPGSPGSNTFNEALNRKMREREVITSGTMSP